MSCWSSKDYSCGKSESKICDSYCWTHLHGDEAPEKHLKSAYQNSLELPISHNCKSIAFPAISCGVYGYPAEEAAEIALSVFMEAAYKDLSIYFYLFSQKMVDIWGEALESVEDHKRID